MRSQSCNLQAKIAIATAIAIRRPVEAEVVVIGLQFHFLQSRRFARQSYYCTEAFPISYIVKCSLLSVFLWNDRERKIRLHFQWYLFYSSPPPSLAIFYIFLFLHPIRLSRRRLSVGIRSPSTIAFTYIIILRTRSNN